MLAITLTKLVCTSEASKEFGFTAGMLKGSLAEGRKPKRGS